MKTEKIQLPDAGNSITITLAPNIFGAMKLKISNWKNTRYYLEWSYKTQYNQKSAQVGWIAIDGSDRKITCGNDEMKAIINKIIEQVNKK